MILKITRTDDRGIMTLSFSKDRLLKKMGKLTSGEIAEMDLDLDRCLICSPNN
jgi:hypothetical protein